MAYSLARPDAVGTRAAAPGSPAEIAIVGALIILALYYGQAVLVPFALAIILSFALAPAVRLLRRIGLPNAPAVIVVVIVAFGAILTLGALVTQQIGHLAQEIPRYQLILKDKVKTLKAAAQSRGGALERAGDVLESLENEIGKSDPKPEAKPDAKSGASPTAPGPAPLAPLAGAPGPAPDHPVPVEVHYPEPTPLDQLQKIAGIAFAPLATAGLVIVFVLFLLLQREDVRDRAIRLLGSSDLERSTTAMDDAGDRLSSYFLGLTAINAAYGLVVGVALWFIGVPSPVLWGALAMIMRIVPFVGWIIAAIGPLLLAAAVDSGWSMFLWTVALFVGSEPIMGNVIEPIVQGSRTGLSPLAVIVATAFWTLLWGPVGLLVAIPLTVVLVVLGSHVERLEFLSVILGDTPPLTPPERFYQRMLAGDPAEASEQAEKCLKERPLVDYYDDVMVAGLKLAQNDVDRGTLEPERLKEIHDASELVIDTLDDAPLRPKKKHAKKAEGEEAKEANGETAGEEAKEPEAEDVIAALAPEQIAADWRHENAILCVPSRTPLDETAALALAQVLSKCGLGAKVLPVGDTRRGALTDEQLAGTRAICITSLDVRERSAHARFLARRLKRSAPEATLIGGFFTLDPQERRDRELIESIPVDEAAYSLRDAVSFCVRLAKVEEDVILAQEAAPRPVEMAAAAS